MRRVRRAERGVEEERPLGCDRRVIAQEARRAVDQILGEVVALARETRGIDVLVPDDELGPELIGLAAEEPVVPVEPARERTVVERAGR